MDFDTLMARWPWRPIRNCPGRFALAPVDPTLALEALVGRGHHAQEVKTAAARDTVLVLPIAGGGLISYRRDDGTYLHTLNTAEGFQRKLAQLGIEGLTRHDEAPATPAPQRSASFDSPDTNETSSRRVRPR